MAKVLGVDDVEIINAGLCSVEGQFHKRAVLDCSIEQWIHLMADDKRFKRAHEINHNRYKRISRYRSKIKQPVLSGNALFVTLTFRDDVLSSTSIQTRRHYVRNWFKAVSPTFYVANIDYGKKNEREHYHGVILDSKELALFEVFPWPYGFSKIEPCGNSDVDNTRLAKYIVKLTSHAFKASGGKRQYCIYSRNR